MKNTVHITIKFIWLKIEANLLFSVITRKNGYIGKSGVSIDQAI